jgi:fumarylacetoacetate (FAA) hydrolase
VVSRDLAVATTVPKLAPSLQAALEDWQRIEAELREIYRLLNYRQLDRAMSFDPALAAAPLPRAYQWLDGSAYPSHAELMMKGSKTPIPASLHTEPMMYQGGSDHLSGPEEPIRCADESWGIDFEAELAVITDDVPMGVTHAAAGAHIRLVMLANDVSLRTLQARELAAGFGFVQSKPATAFSPVAVTPDELGAAWDGRRLHRPLLCEVNGKAFGHPDAGTDMAFDFPTLIAHAARTRALQAGTIIGSGTVSNRNPETVGSCCIAERRMIETLAEGAPKTPFLRFGDRVRIEMLDEAGRSIFGAIDQGVERHHPPV